MKSKINITDIAKTSVFSVPARYFESLPDQIQARIEVGGNGHLASLDKTSVFQLPASYFRALPAQIQQRIGQTLGLSQQDLYKQDIFQVPMHYWEELPKQIQTRIQAENLGNLEKLAQKEPFKTPDGFFQHLEKNIQTRIQASQAQKLEEIPRTSVWKTPEDYFEKLPNYIQQKVSKTKPTPLWWTLNRWATVGVSLAGIVLLFWWGASYWEESKPNDTIIAKENLDKSREKKLSKETSPALAQPKFEQSGKLTKESESALARQTSVKLLQEESAYLAVNQTLEELPKEAIVDYLEQSPVSEEEIVEALIEQEQAAGGDLLVDLLAQAEEARLYEQLEEEDMETLDILLKSPDQKLEKQ